MVRQREEKAIGVVVTPSAREMFTPRELAAACKEFTEHGGQHQDEETGLSASAYRFGERVLIVYEESEAGVVLLTSPKVVVDKFHKVPLLDSESL